ncbi:hypothetical protein FS837_005806, partial [Tulasnella sp. UAMH 9824]
FLFNMVENSSAKFNVQHPFDAESAGDCILRACDGTEFKVSRLVLSLASTILHDMFALPPVASEPKDQTDVPMIPVEEDAPTLQALLQMIYPMDPPQITSLSLAQKLAVACDKYFISTAKLRLYLRDALNDDRVFKEDPLACYALSWRIGWEEGAIKASRYTHTFQLADSSIAKKLVEQAGDMEALLRLIRMRESREEGIDDLLSIVKNRSHYVCAAGGHGVLLVGLLDYPQRRLALKQRLKEAYTNTQDIENLLGFQVTQTYYSCETCMEGREAHLQAIRAKVRTALEAYPQAISR